MEVGRSLIDVEVVGTFAAAVVVGLEVERTHDFQIQSVYNLENAPKTTYVDA